MPNTETHALAEGLLDPPNNSADDVAAPANVKLELKALSRLSAPVIVQLGALYAIIVVNQYFIGHLGAAPLAAAAIGNTVCARYLECTRNFEPFESMAVTSRVCSQSNCTTKE